MVLASFANLVSGLYRQIGPPGPSGYECKGFADDSRTLRVLNEQIEDTLRQGANVPQREYLLRDQVQNCLSDVGNVLVGGSSGDPGLGLYIGIAGGIAAGIAGVALYKRSKNNGKVKQ